VSSPERDDAQYPVLAQRDLRETLDCIELMGWLYSCSYRLMMHQLYFVKA